MFKPSTRMLSALAAGALLLAPLSACGSASTTNTKSGNSASGSLPKALGGQLTRDNFADAMVKAMQDGKSAHMKMTFGALMNAEGDVEYTGTTSATKMKLTGSGMSGEIIFVDGKLYMSIAGLVPSGKYFKVTSDDPTLGSMLDQMKNLGPDGSVQAMKQGLKDFKYEGKDTIDGDPVSKYSVTVDIAAAAKSLGTSAEDLKGAPKEVTYLVYVDSKNLMRRMTMDLAGQSMQMDITNWGEPVSIKAPPASEVVKTPALPSIPTPSS